MEALGQLTYEASSEDFAYFSQHGSWPLRTPEKTPERLNRFNAAALTVGRYTSWVLEPEIRDLVERVRKTATTVLVAKDVASGQQALTDVGVVLKRLEDALGAHIRGAESNRAPEPVPTQGPGDQGGLR